MDAVFTRLLEKPEMAVQLVVGVVILYVVRYTVPAAIKMTLDSMTVQRELDRAERAADRADVRENIQVIVAGYNRIAEEVRVLSERVYGLAQEVARNHKVE